MNIDTQRRILKACKICGLKASPARSLMTGNRYVSLTNNDNAFDTISFHPNNDLGHAMELLTAIGGTIEINNSESKCYVRLENCFNEWVIGSWASEPNNKTKNICNAILDWILTKSQTITGEAI